MGIRELIIEILREIELVVAYEHLCRTYDNFEKRMNLKGKEIEVYIKSYDQGFKYVAKDSVFVREMEFNGYFVRFFLSFKGGIVDFSYLVWEKENNQNCLKGRLASLVEIIDPQFDQKVKYKTPIATSLDDFNDILSEIFKLFNSFIEKFKRAAKA